MAFFNKEIEPLSTEQQFYAYFPLLFSLGFLITSFCSRRIWLWYGSVVVGIQGLGCMIQPQGFLSGAGPLFEINLSVDGLHLHLVRCIGAILFAGAVLQFRLSDRDFDSTIFTSVVFTRVIVCKLLLINGIYGYVHCKAPASKPTKISYRELIMHTLCLELIVQIFGGFVQLWRCPTWGGYPEFLNRLNVHIRLDHLFTFLTGLVTFAVPEFIIHFETTLEQGDAMHLDLLRVFGILVIGSSILMGRSTNFLRDNDKVTLLECRILQNLLLLPLCIYAHNFYSVYNVTHIFYGILGIAAWTLNALVAYLDTKRHPKLHEI